ncbi:maleylpyruvate isomerase family mycothiol-dependent enzyme [Streptacidiphilus sp. N1-12]|uniref:Maleylpyruvate isomerase family mycothiol-dependent enzyme n=2 Tax=Streptacidiphilus alkalitolerans TaxID=3342712 RepID=A0ABV6V707_9ACTN
MHRTPEFPDLLRLIDERATAFRAVIASAPSLDARVPTCPEWTLFDLAQHLGQGRRFRAAIVAAGPADAPPAEAVAERTAPAPREREELLAWLAATTQQLLDTLLAADPEGGCWTGWGPTQLTDTCGSVARHQVQEIAVHTYDAQVAVGAPQPLPTEVALDGVEENLFISSFTTSAWPHKPTAFDLHAAEGRSWRLTVDGDGARTTRLPAAGQDPDAAGLSLHGTASDLVLYLYKRIPVDSLRLDGDPELLDLLLAWEPEDWA